MARQSNGPTTFGLLLILGAIAAIAGGIGDCFGSDEGEETYVPALERPSGGGGGGGGSQELANRAENILRASGAYSRYDVRGIEPVGIDGLFVRIDYFPDSDAEDPATAVCVQIASLPDRVTLIRVYGNNGDEIDVPACGAQP